jgi:hypothetical protein
MKLLSIVKVAVLALPLMLVSCKSHKNVTTDNATTHKKVKKGDLISNVQDNAQTGKFFTSKVKFSVEVGPQKLTLTGNLRMRRHDVIRLQLMAFGFVEAGRIELTKEYVLIMDRINKQYLKVPWISVDFLRNSGIDFNTIQSLFWNELFVPENVNFDSPDEKGSGPYNMMESGSDMILSLEASKLDYSWLVNKQTAHIKMANIMYKDKVNGASQLNWDYDEFKPLNKTQFPHKHLITLTTGGKEVKLGMTLNHIGSDTEWEPRTMISNKYREVTVDDILSRFLAL